MKDIVITPRKVLAVLLTGAVSVVLLHFLSFVPMALGMRDEPIHMFHMDVEQNFSAVYATLLMWICSCLVWFIVCVEVDVVRRRKWMGLGAVFAFLGLDELLSFHERLAYPVHEAFKGLGMYGFAWVVPYAIVLVVLLVVYAGFWWRLPHDTRLQTALGGALFVGGGMGCELIGWVLVRMKAGEFAWQVEILAEELFEMAGAIVLIMAFVNHIDRHFPEHCLRITSSVSKP